MNNNPTILFGVQQFLAVLARMLLSAIFLMSGVHKIMAWDETVTQMQSEGLANASVLLPLAIAAEIGGGLSVLLGLWGRLGAFGLFVFLIPTTFIFHDFWTYEGQQQQMQMQHFMKNITIMGGLLMVTAFGSGAWSITGLRRPREST